MTTSTTGHKNEMIKDTPGNFALVNGLSMSYELHGTGSPPAHAAQLFELLGGGTR